MALKITNENYAEVMGKGLPVVIDFWATWCGPCRMIAPIIEELAEEYDGKVLIGKCDVEEGDEVAPQYMVRNVPTIIFIKDGKQVDKLVGAASKDQIKAKVEELEKKGTKLYGFECVLNNKKLAFLGDETLNPDLYDKRMEEYKKGDICYSLEELENAKNQLEVLSLVNEDKSDEQIISIVDYIDSTLINQLLAVETSTSGLSSSK